MKLQFLIILATSKANSISIATQLRNSKCMKKFSQLILFIIFILCVYKTQSQCEFENFFPVKMGMTLYEGKKSLVLNRGFGNIVQQFEYWTKDRVPKNDSVYIERWEISLKTSTCYPGDTNNATLFFADDKFYLIYLTISFKPNKASDGMTFYENLISYFSKKYPAKIAIDRKSGRTGKKIGDGFNLFKSVNNQTNLDERISISYLIMPRINYDRSTQKMSDDSQIESFDIEIEYINLNLTKMK